MHRSVIPCQRRNLPLNSVGNVIKAITTTIIGISIICEVLYPKSLLPSGITNGEIVTAVPDTSTKLKILAPMILPNDKAPCPLASAVIAVTSSGRDVQRATTVTPITSVGIPAMVANETEDASNISAPKAINAALIISWITSLTSEPVFWSSSISQECSSSGFLMPLRMVMPISIPNTKSITIPSHLSKRPKIYAATK